MRVVDITRLIDLYCVRRLARRLRKNAGVKSPASGVLGDQIAVNGFEHPAQAAGVIAQLVPVGHIIFKLLCQKAFKVPHRRSPRASSRCGCEDICGWTRCDHVPASL